MTSPFRFKQFSIAHDKCAHKVGTDGTLLGAWAEANNPKKILDIGSGSGLIALMLAQRFPKAEVTGIELDPDSAEQAKENTISSPFADRVEIIKDDFLNHSFTEKFDLIVSNPPFFKGVYSSGNEKRDRARHEFSLPQKGFIAKAAQLLNPEGKLAVILSVEGGSQLAKVAKEDGLHLNRITSIKGAPKARVKRLLLEFTPQQGLFQEDYLTLRNHHSGFAEAYKELTADFYLNLV